MRPEFVAPEFTKESDPEIIQERMMKNLPADISDMPGDFPYDYTMPTAIEVSQLIQFHLVRALMVAFPEFAWGEWLDYHGGHVHVVRRAANKATGYVTVTGEPGTVIDRGTVFCVPATDTREAIEFAATQAGEIEGGTVELPVEAVLAGTGANVAVGTISLMSRPLKGIVSITNEKPITGGSEIEDDESYYERIHAEYEGAESYVGNDSDYIRWAKEVEGIGDCIVDPVWNGPGTVKLILVDSSGRPANEQLVNAVYDHIVSPGDRSKRLLPAGDATLTVTAAKTKVMVYECTGMRLVGITVTEAQEAFAKAVLPLYLEAKAEGVLRYNDVRPVLSKIQGIEDFTTFTINGGQENIELAKDEYADTASVTFTVLAAPLGEG